MKVQELLKANIQRSKVIQDQVLIAVVVVVVAVVPYFCLINLWPQARLF